MNKKKKFGQFFTTNSSYIVGNLTKILPADAVVVDPFAGNWDLLNMVKDGYEVEAYDIDPKNEDTIKQDTLLDPPDYKNKWIITNPPYLSKNKCKDKAIYDKYNTDDLYKVSLKTIIGCEGGIIIIPVNFFSSYDDDIRKEFLSKYRVKKLRIFEEQVFSDTSYTVCAFSFFKKDNNSQELKIEFMPSKEKMICDINDEDGFIVGSEFFKIIDVQSKLSVGRLVDGDKSKDFTKLFLRAVDTGTNNGRISLSLKDEPFYAKHSDRAFATITLSKKLSTKQQEFVAKEFNRMLEKYRKKYHSLFLTNFRNSTAAYARKRIEFKTAYNMIKYIIETKMDA